MRELNFDALLPISLALVASTSAKCQSGGNESHLEVVNSWQQSVKIALPDPKGVAASVIDGASNPIGIKVFNDNIYMTIPRWNRGQRVPVNLGVTPKPVMTSIWTNLFIMCFKGCSCLFRVPHVCEINSTTSEPNYF